MSVTHTVTHTTLKARSARRYKVNGAPAGFTALELPSEMPSGGASETAPSPSAPTPHKALASGASGSFCSLPRGLCLSSLFFYDLGQTLPLSLDFCLSRRASLGLEAKALLLDLSQTLPFGIGRGFSGLQRGLYLTSLIFNLG